MTENARDYLLENYFIDELGTERLIKEEYPDLFVYRIAPFVLNIEAPKGKEAEIERLRIQLPTLQEPSLFGLNAKAALSEANILQFHEYPFGELRGKGVLVGFVDTGIDYTLDIFKNADNTTRIQSIWDQTIDGDPPPNYSYGTEYTKEDINRALQAEDPYEIVPSKDEIGHGTFLAGITAGYDQIGETQFVGGAPSAEIVMVKLRPAKTYLREFYLIDEETIAYQENHLLSGINYLLNVASLQQKPLVICIGVGNNDGAHTGNTIVERYIEDVSIAQNIIITTAGGNEASTGHHYHGRIREREQQNIEINVAEEEAGFVLQVWVDIADKLAVGVRSPLGEVKEKIPIINSKDQVFDFKLEETTMIVRYVYPNPQTGAENVLIRLEKPTVGLWTVIIYGEDIVNGSYDIWLPREGFVEPDTKFLNPDPFITVNNPGTNNYNIVVGAYDDIDGSVYVSSGRGPTRAPVDKPEFIAPGVNIIGPTPGGGTTTFVGTSASAAITAAASTLLMEWAVINGNLLQMNTRIARGILIRGAVRTRSGIYPNPIEGFGKLDLRRSIANT